MQNRRRFLETTGLGIAALAGLSRPVFAAEKTPPALIAYLQRAGYYPVELERDDNNNLLVKGRLNEAKATFLVDTGWPISAAENKLLKDCKTLGELDAKLEDEVLGRVDWKDIHLVSKLRLAGAEFLNQPVIARAMKTPDRKAWQAALGLDFLLRQHAIIDCLTGWLCVRGSEPDAAVREAISGTLTRSGFVEVPLTPPGGFRLLCEARLNKQPVTLLVDTGAVFSLLDDGAADKLKLPRQVTGWQVRGLGKIGASELHLARVANWSFGDATAYSIGIGVASLERWSISHDGAPKDSKTDKVWLVADGLLGADHLFEFGAVIDCGQRRLWLHKERMARSRYRRE